MGLGAFFQKLKDGLAKTRAVFTEKVKTLLLGSRLDADTLEQLEELMIAADLGVELTTHVIDRLNTQCKNKEFTKDDDIIQLLRQEIRATLDTGDTALHFATQKPTIILIAGVNGSGKTTSIAKLTNYLRKQGKTVLLCAGDTFRAAAVEQLSIWAERLGVEIVKQATGADPAAVCFTAVDAGISRGVDVILIDTAGRLHTQTNLMNELEKIRRIVERKIPGAPHETLLVIDATTGQNGIQQAKQFNASVKVTGLILSKLDGTAKGGVIVQIKKALGIPVKFIGMGEHIDALQPFDPDAFVDALLES